MTRYRISDAAAADIAAILAWSHENFGEQARQRYEDLILGAIRDIAADPARLGSKERPELGDGVRSWHLRGSRGTRLDAVRRPRHFLIYRIAEDCLVLGRVLHEAMDLRRHLSKETWD